MKPKVVILSAFASPFRSGAESCSEEVAAALQDRFDVLVVTARLKQDNRGPSLPSGVPVLRLGFGLPADKWLFPLLAPIAMLMLRPRLIHAVLESYAGLALTLCRFTAPGAKRLLTCQSTNTRLLLRTMHRSAHRVTAISSALVERAEQFGCTDVRHIPNGLRLTDIPRAQKVPGRVLFAGRHESMKGIDTLLRAFATVSSPDAHLRIAGDGSKRRAYEQLAEELGIADRVTFLGFIPMPDVYQEFAEAQVFCGLSRSEALGNVFLEAQAAECAVIGTRVGGIPDIVEDGRTGILVEPDDPEAAAKAIMRLLKDAGLQSSLAEAGMHHAAKYDWSRIAGQYAKVYEELL